jgi:subtilisin family serine protease
MVVVLSGSPDLSPADSISGGAAKRQYVYDRLRHAALSTQTPLVGWLKARGAETRQFWIVNAVLTRGDLGLAWEMASRPDVLRVEPNPLVQGLLPFSPDASERAQADPAHGTAGDPIAADSTDTRGAFAPDAIEWGVTAVHAPDVWASGNRGEGVVVASLDTGVSWTHPAIKGKYRGWNGSIADHTFSWHDSIQHTTVAFDDNNHGTHTTGTMVGDDGAGHQIGVAPGARWIGCRNMDHGAGTPARYLECAEWALAPYAEGTDPLEDGHPELGADITNNSWTCPPEEGCSVLTMKNGFDAIRAAGQMTVSAAGNAGTNSSSGSACNRVVDPPAIYDSVFTTGALTQVNPAYRIASYSSTGPVLIDGSGRMKPNVAAPGSGVLSSIIGGGYASFNGTSMASPHNAGVTALLWAAKPNLRDHVNITRCYIQQSAGPVTVLNATSCGGTTQNDRPNNFNGWGIVNAQAAIGLGPDMDGDFIADACDCDPDSGGSSVRRPLRRS